MILLLAIVSVFLALIFYSTSIFNEIIRKNFSLKISIFFWLGFFFDLLGTVLMFLISKGFSFNFHSIIGIVALVLMGIKAVWSWVNYKNGAGKKIPATYTVSVFLLWIFVFVLGFALT